MDKDYVILLENVSKKYRLYKQKKDRAKEALHPFGKKFHKDFYAVKDMDLKVKKGEILGIIGRNGSGKSTLLKLIAGVIMPTGGTVKTHGNVVPLLELGSGLNPEYSGMENIYFYSSILGFTRKETEKRVKDIIDFADIGDFIYQPLKTYSSGMKARLAFAVSVNIDPDILILDEVLAVGDELFRRKSFAKMEEFFKAGKTILFVSHSIGSVSQLCTRAIMIDEGEILLNGHPRLVTSEYLKFSFSSPEKKLSLKKDLKLLNSDEQRKAERVSLPSDNLKPSAGNKKSESSQEKKTMQTQQPLFLPNLVSKNQSVQKRADIDINDLQITTPDGKKKVNCLVFDDEYIFSYRVKFNEAVSKIAFPFLIKNEKGIRLSGSRYPHEFNYNIRSGTEFLIKWKFRCSLLHGNYYIDILIPSMNKVEKEFLVSMFDAFTFKVLKPEFEKNGVGYFGIFNLDQQATVVEV